MPSEVHADVACLAKHANVITDIHVFGYRVHTHVLGTVVSGYKYDLEVSNSSIFASAFENNSVFGYMILSFGI